MAHKVRINTKNSLVHSHTDASSLLSTIWLLQQMLLSSLMTPARGPLRDRRDAQGSQVTNPRTLALDPKRSSVDPKRSGTLFAFVFVSLCMPSLKASFCPLFGISNLFK